FQNDMFNGSMGTAITGGINAAPAYASGNGNNNADGGLYQLAAGTKGLDAAVRIPNFNDHFNGSAPDVGVAEAGDAAMKFGIAAASAASSAGGTGSTTTTTPGTSTGSSGGSSGSGTAPGAAPVSATMASSAYTAAAGQSVTFTAAVMGSSGTPTGSVTFTDNGSVMASCTGVALSGGK